MTRGGPANEKMENKKEKVPQLRLFVVLRFRHEMQKHETNSSSLSMWH